MRTGQAWVRQCALGGLIGLLHKRDDKLYRPALANQSSHFALSLLELGSELSAKGIEADSGLAGNVA